MNREDFLLKLPEVLATYHPNDDVRQHITRLDFVPVIGPSGVGKDTVIKATGLPFVISDMSRPSRPGEENGIDAIFRRDFDHLLEELRDGKFVQAVSAQGGQFYGSHDNSYPPSGPSLMPFVAKAVPGIRKLGFRSVTPVFITAPSYEEWMHRYESRPGSEQERAKRLAEARQSLELSLADEGTTFVLNDKVESAALAIRQILGLADLYPSAKDEQARQAAQAMLRGLILQG